MKKSCFYGCKVYPNKLSLFLFLFLFLSLSLSLSLYIYIYIYIYDKISGNSDKSDAYKEFGSDISFFTLNKEWNITSKPYVSVWSIHLPTYSYHLFRFTTISTYLFVHICLSISISPYLYQLICLSSVSTLNIKQLGCGWHIVKHPTHNTRENVCMF